MSLTRLASRLSTRRLLPLTRPLTTVTPVSSPATFPASSSSVRPHHIVISVAGEDRVGIVRTVTSAIATQKANVEESKMAILGGDFAMILHVSAETSSCADALASRLKSELSNFSVTVRETTPPEETAEKSMWTLTLEGPDSPGIVAEVTGELAAHGANVHEMDTETTTAPFAGYLLFRMTGKIAMTDEELDNLSSALEKVEDKFGSNISLEQIPATAEK